MASGPSWPARLLDALTMQEARVILIAGVPRAGKTTLAEWVSLKTGFCVRHTDDMADREWSEASLVASTWLDAPGSSIIEGTAVPRALRKWLARSSGRPCDIVVWCGKPNVALSTGQLTMAKGCLTVWCEVLPELQRRGVRIEQF